MLEYGYYLVSCLNHDLYYIGKRLNDDLRYENMRDYSSFIDEKAFDILKNDLELDPFCDIVCFVKDEDGSDMFITVLQRVN